MKTIKNVNMVIALGALSLVTSLNATAAQPQEVSAKSAAHVNFINGLYNTSATAGHSKLQPLYKGIQFLNDNSETGGKTSYNTVINDADNQTLLARCTGWLKTLACKYLGWAANATNALIAQWMTVTLVNDLKVAIKYSKDANPVNKSALAKLLNNGEDVVGDEQQAKIDPVMGYATDHISFEVGNAIKSHKLYKFLQARISVLIPVIDVAPYNESAEYFKNAIKNNGYIMTLLTDNCLDSAELDRRMRDISTGGILGRVAGAFSSAVSSMWNALSQAPEEDPDVNN